MDVKKLLSDNITMEQIRSVGWRMLSIVASSIYFANIPILLFLIYMHQHGIFSYDFYERGLFGLHVFFAFIVLSILVFAVAFWAFLLPVVRKMARSEPMGWKQLSLLLVISLLFWMLIILFMIAGVISGWQRVVYVLLLSLLVAIQVGMIISASASAQFYSLAIIMLLSLALTVHLHVAASELVGKALAAFGAGGGICTEVSDTRQTYSVVGELVLAAPEYIYVKELDSNGITTIRVDSSTTYRVIRDRCDSATNGEADGEESKEPTPGQEPTSR